MRHSHLTPLPDADMKEPGGLLIWEESHPLPTAIKANPGVSSIATTQLLTFITMSGKHTGLLTDWLEDLPGTVSKHGLEVIKHEVFDWHKENLKPMTENLLTVMRNWTSIYLKKANL